MYCVYILSNTCNNRTYLGITNRPERRIRQHNCDIKGGAKYTTSFKGNGKWIYHFQLLNLNKSQALSIERTIKNKRNNFRGKDGLRKKIEQIKILCDNLQINNPIFKTHF